MTFRAMSRVNRLDRWILTIFLWMLLVLTGCREDGGHGDSTTASKTVSAGEGYNFVVVLTDDQRWDTLWAMPMVQDKLIDHGITFANAYASNPVCCPTRASLLAGGFYSQNTGVLHNKLPNGGAQKFYDSESLATLLQKAGYKTALIGKYLNEYRHIARTHTAWLDPFFGYYQ